ncbi:MAG: hypothetical protein SFU98_10475 [Leptospiraceae bacterium]|nr:hypothetical protein [Leptospiraceae bacterium]
MSEALANGLKLHRVSFVAPWLHDSKIAELVYGGKSGVEDLKKKSDIALEKFKSSKKVDYIVAASDTDKTAAMFGPFDYYLNPKRGKVKEWGNQFAVMAWRDWLEYNPILFAPKIKTPILIIHSKDAAIPMGAEKFFSKLKSEKDFQWIENLANSIFMTKNQPLQIQ